MTQLPEVINVNEVPEDDRNFEPIPAGVYTLQVIESRVEFTKTGSGQMLTLTLEVIGGQFAGRRIWDRLNIRNENADAQRIAIRALADLCGQLNIPQLQDSEQLHFKPFKGRVTVQPDKTGQYGPQNRVRYNVTAQNAGQQPQQQAQQRQPQQRPQQQQRPAQGGGGSNKPWNNPQQRPQAQQAGQTLDDEVPF